MFAEPERKEIDLTSDYQPGQVPLLMQWDRRWGYDSYGQEMVGVAGCGSTCMTMAYLYLTGDTAMNPRKMAAYAYEADFIRRQGQAGISLPEAPGNWGCQAGNFLLGRRR